MDQIRAGVVQFDIRTGDTAGNVAQALDGLKVIGTAGGRLAVLGEMWSCGFDYDRLRVHAKETPQVLKQVQAVAARFKMVICGSLPEYDAGNIYNTAWAVDADGRIAGAYRKVHLFSLTGEQDHFAAGDRAVVCETAIGRIGLVVCYDLRFPELCRALADGGAELMAVSAQWPYPRTRHWEVLLQARAIENQLFVVAANRVGTAGSLRYEGSSRIVSPYGQVQAALGSGAGVLTADLDFSEVKQYREMLPCLADRVPAAYQVG